MMSPSDPKTTAIAAAAPPAVVRVSGLEKAYGAVKALCGVDFEVPAGSVLGFLGPNGAGKTTAIKILTGYLSADSGSVEVCGFDVAQSPLQVKRRIGYLPENNPLYLEMRVVDFLTFTARSFSLHGAEAQKAIHRAVQLTGLETVYRRKIAHCSKGFRQRVGLAQALLHDPQLLILDEPTNGLDPLQIVEMRKLIRALGRTKTIIITSHVLPEIEALVDRVLLLHQGRKVAEGSLAEIVGHSGGACVAQISLRCTEKEFLAVAESSAAVVVEMRASAFPVAGVVSALVRVSGTDGLAQFAANVATRQFDLLELAPQSGTLEALFQNLSVEIVG